MYDKTRYECEQSIARAARAYNYTMGTLSQDDAQWLIHDIQPVVGWYPLECLSESSVMDTVLCAKYEDHPELPRLIHEACQRVWSKWSSSGDVAGAAEDWALELVDHYADEDGIELKPLDEEEAA